MSDTLGLVADASADVPQATPPTLRSPDGLFHGLHGQQAAARTGGVIPAPGVRKCKRCGAPMHPDATHCPRGHARGLERRVEEAIHLQRRGGGRYDPHLHPRDREGMFRDAPSMPQSTAMPPEPPTRRESARANAEARDAIERANPNAIPEPSGETAPGSLAGKDLTRVHPKAIDTELARLYGEGGKWSSYIGSITQHHARDQASDRQHGREPREMDASTQATLERYRAKLAEVEAEAAPLDGEFVRRGMWSRYFKVTNGNGHVHKSMHCSTCFPTTEFAWLYELAGKNEHEMVQAHGESACSVCFPSAPSEYEAMKAAGHVSHAQRASNAERDARNAERQRRAAAKAEKAIANPDGSPLKLSGRFGDTIGSLVTARNKLVDTINDVRQWEGMHAARTRAGVDAASVAQSASVLAEHRADLEMLLAAIAYKLGKTREQVMAEAQAKADAKWRRETWRSS